MKKYLILVLTSILTLSLLLAACTKEEGLVAVKNESDLPADTETSTPSDPPITLYLAPIEPSEGEKYAEFLEKSKRKGEIDLDNIENIGVKGDLLDGVMALLEAVKMKDEKTKLKHHYNPTSFLTFGSLEEPYVLAITKIQLDDTYLKGMTEEYELKKFASDVAIVDITTTRYDINYNIGEGTAHYIFVKVDGIWKVFRTF